MHLLSHWFEWDVRLLSCPLKKLSIGTQYATINVGRVSTQILKWPPFFLVNCSFHILEAWGSTHAQRGNLSPQGFMGRQRSWWEPWWQNTQQSEACSSGDVVVQECRQTYQFWLFCLFLVGPECNKLYGSWWRFVLIKTWRFSGIHQAICLWKHWFATVSSHMRMPRTQAEPRTCRGEERLGRSTAEDSEGSTAAERGRVLWQCPSCKRKWELDCRWWWVRWSRMGIDGWIKMSRCSWKDIWDMLIRPRS